MGNQIGRELYDREWKGLYGIMDRGKTKSMEKTSLPALSGVEITLLKNEDVYIKFSGPRCDQFLFPPKRSNTRHRCLAVF